MVSIRTANKGLWLSAEGNGGGALHANRVQASTWERFRWNALDLNDAIVLMTGHGWLLRSDVESNRLTAASPCTTRPSHLVVVPSDDNTVAFRTHEGTYLSAHDGGGSHVEVNRTEIRSWERFRIHDWAKDGEPPLSTWRRPGGVTPRPLPGGTSGMLIDERVFHTAFNYVDPFWSPGRMFTASHDEFEDSLASWHVFGNVCLCTAMWGPASDGYSFPYDALANIDQTKRRLDRMASAGLAPILFLSDNHLIERYGWNFQRLYDTAYDVAKTFGEHIRWLIGPWEGAEVMGGRYNRERRLMLEAMRRGLDDAGRRDVRLGRHERAMEGVFVEDLQHLGPVASLIQTGFGATIGEIQGFVRDDSARMRRFAEAGRFDPHDHLYVAAEHSIPYISPRWQPNQTWAEARYRGQAALNAGADLDFSGGRVKSDA